MAFVPKIANSRIYRVPLRQIPGIIGIGLVAIAKLMTAQRILGARLSVFKAVGSEHMTLWSSPSGAADNPRQKAVRVHRCL